MGRLPSSLRELLFKWVIIIYDIIDNKAPLRHVYDVILHYIQYDSLRQVVCQLLCYLTTREEGECAWTAVMQTCLKSTHYHNLAS